MGSQQRGPGRVVLLLGLVACTETPDLPPQGADAHGLLLLVHGSGDDPGVWSAELAASIAAELSEPGLWDVVPYDWSSAADSKLRAARRGQRIGAELAVVIGEQRDYEQLHVVAHSAGAHVADALVQDLEGPLEQLTLLDPFGGLGLVRWGYGRRHFGECAAFAEAYLNTLDGVPSTDRPPETVHTFDVTALAPDPEAAEAHWWPTDFYAASAGSGVGLDLSLPLGDPDSWDAFPPGEQTTL